MKFWDNDKKSLTNLRENKKQSLNDFKKSMETLWEKLK